jgi:hypothetical protein
MAASVLTARRIDRQKEGFKEFLQRISGIDLDAPDSGLFKLN